MATKTFITSVLLLFSFCASAQKYDSIIVKKYHDFVLAENQAADSLLFYHKELGKNPANTKAKIRAEFLSNETRRFGDSVQKYFRIIEKWEK